MKSMLIAFSLLSFVSIAAAEPAVTKPVPAPGVTKDVPAMVDQKAAPEDQGFDRKKVSYALGYNYGKALLKNDKDIDVSEIVKGLQDGLNPAAKERFDEKESQELLMSYYTHLRKKFAEEQEKQKEKNVEAGKAFMEQNKKKPGVVEDPSGLQYRIIQEGAGPSPKNDDAVEIEVKAKTIDGNTFFDTKVEGQPANVVVSRVIPGWSIALQKMKKGAIWEVFVPPALGYGDKSVSEEIGPDSTLIFELHLVDIKPDAHAQTQEHPKK